MKKFIFIALLLLSALPVKAGLEEANENYRAGRFEAALSEYQQLLKTEQRTPFLYYNIGNSYFKLGKYGQAVLYYTKAFNLKPRDADIRKNYALALNMTGQTPGPANTPEIFFYITHFFSVSELKGIAVLAAWGLALSFSFWLYRRRFLVIAIIFLCVFIGAGAWAAALNASLENRAVTVLSGTELRGGPGVNFPSSATVSEGYSVKVIDAKDNWKHIIVYPGLEDGWVDSKNIVLLEEI